MRSHAVERTSMAPVPGVGKKPMMRDLVSTARSESQRSAVDPGLGGGCQGAPG